ncbi:hypothetical protein BLOT_011077 [Blomia tropicalis]|nr:hypothetical protein BLOT_011077 [Blomia tropicalis]
MTFSSVFAIASLNRYYDQPIFHEMFQHLGFRIAHSLAAVNGPECFDVVIVGGGIVGAATARQLSINKSKLRMAIVEKEAELGLHQTGHNSGVIHAGIYYKPGSLKARLCVEGSALAYQYLEKKKLPYKRIGKLIVACDEIECNQTPEEIKAIEPNCVGLKAIWSPNTGIVDWAMVNRSYADDFRSNGGKVLTKFEVSKFRIDEKDEGKEHPLVITSLDGREIRARYVITAAGLQSDKVAKLTQGKKIPQIVPFRGEYLVLKKERSDLVRTNIYPVPDPRFPFLGVHFTPRMDGSIWLGPNAVLAFAREGYRFSDLNPSDLFQTLMFVGFRRLAFKYASAGLDEFWRSLSVKSQLKQLQRFVPSIRLEDIDRTVKVAGIRAQALDEMGNLVDDFVFEVDQNSKRVLHVRNAPSPGSN